MRVVHARQFSVHGVLGLRVQFYHCDLGGTCPSRARAGRNENQPLPEFNFLASKTDPMDFLLDFIIQANKARNAG